MKSDLFNNRALFGSILFVFCIQLIAHGQTNSRWQWLNPLPQGNRLTDIVVIDNATAIAIGSASTVMKTTDSGAHWDIRHNVGGTHLYLNAIAFGTHELGMIVSDSGIVLRSTNCGASWNRIAFPTNEPLFDVAFSNPTTAFILGSTCYRTTNAGGEWIPLSHNFMYPRTIAFASDSVGVLLDAYGIVHRTTNQGTTWNAQQIADSFATLLSISFADTIVGFIVGFLSGGDTTNRGTICLRTTDAGIHWTTQCFRRPVGVRGIAAIDSNIAVSIMSFDGQREGPIILRTTNGGRSWYQAIFPSSTGNYLKRITMHKSGVGFTVGDFGYILKTTDRGFSWVGLSTNVTHAHRAHFVDSVVGTAISSSGEIHGTTDAGQTWTRQMRDTTRNFTEVWFGDALNGTIVGWYGDILKTTNGGSDWFRQTSPTQEILTAVHFTNPRIGNIVGWEGTYLRTTNGGTTWHHNPIGDNYFSSVFFADSLLGLISGWYGMIFKTTDSGTTWVLKTQGQADWFYGVTFLDNTVAIAVGSGGLILRSTDSGETWTRISTPTESYLYAVRFYDRTMGLAVGEGGILLLTKDGGLSWQLIQSVTSNGLYSISFLTSKTAILTGEGGTILRLSLENPVAVEEPMVREIPQTVQLSQNYPNPFNPSTVIRFSLPYSTFVKLIVFDILGREIQTLVNGQQQAGYHSIEWRPELLSSGIYLYQLQTSSSSVTRKLLLLR